MSMGNKMSLMYFKKTDVEICFEGNQDVRLEHASVTMSRYNWKRMWTVVSEKH